MRGVEELGGEEVGEGEGEWRDDSVSYDMLLLALHWQINDVKGRVTEAGKWDRLERKRE